MPGKHTELEGPQYLTKDQNFYDQVPFWEVLNRTAMSEYIGLSQIRSTFTVVCRFTDRQTPPEFRGNLEKLAYEYIKDPEHSPKGLRAMVREQAKKDGILPYRRGYAATRYLDAVGSAIIDLEAYPLCVEYVATQLSPYEYLPDGTKKLDVEGDFLQESYLAWSRRGLKNRHILGKKGVLVGVEEVYPPDSRGSNWLSAPTKPGRELANVPWKILSLAEPNEDR